MEAKEPMEGCSVLDTGSLIKRKAESEPLEEIEESGDDEYVDPDDELINPTWWKAPEWDVDSFDGLEYHSSQEENELSDKEAEEKWRRYKRLVIESKVEFVEVVRGNFTIGSRSKSYITFLAREKPDGPLVEYQAKVWCTFVKGENYPILCRPAPKSKPTNQN